MNTSFDVSTTSNSTASSASKCSKDSAIKLFGTKIPLDSKDSFNEITKVDAIREQEVKLTNSRSSMRISKGNKRQTWLTGTKQTSKKEPVETEGNAAEQDRAVKRPTKIIPCPRCNSSETKFCYFNNYNVNQPRHFCKNCQRYWTAGGTVRNVPIGSGCRKNKHLLASQFRQMLVENSESVNHQTMSSAESQTASLPSTGGNALVLNFGSESIGAVPNEPSSYEFPETVEPQQPNLSSSNPSTPCIFSRNPKASAEYSYYAQQFQSFPMQVLAVPLQLMPVMHWGSVVPTWDFGAGSETLSVTDNCNSPSSSSTSSCGTGNGSLALGKHSRASNYVVDPKIVRLNNPNKASNSPLISTLRHEPEQKDSMPKDANFGPFQPESKAGFLNGTRIVQANPVVISRSHF